MNLEKYRKQRAQQTAAAFQQVREFCALCRRSRKTCYCDKIESFDPKIRFAILIHGREAQRRIATGRIAHRCLSRSWLLEGYNYSHDERVNAILDNPAFHCVVLYPGPQSLDVADKSALPALVPSSKELVIFVIDGTWITARKTMQRSTNLLRLPQICFTPSRTSRFRVRKQPQEHFFSTIEAIHETVERLGPYTGFDTAARTHDRLLTVFDSVVDQQLELSSGPKLKSQWSPRKATKRL